MNKHIFFVFFILTGINEISNAQLMKPGQVATTFSYASNVNGYVLSVVDVRGYKNAIPSQNWEAPMLKPLTDDSIQWRAERMGEVFGVTIDDKANIYVAATNVYGASVFGTAGSGGIYRVNAADWSVTDFVLTDPNSVSQSTTLIPNIASGLGNICYDKWHNQLFVTNLEDGKI